MQAIDGIGCDADRGHEAERVTGRVEVVVGRLRHGDHRDAHVAETLRDAKRAVAADRDDAVDAELVNVFDDELRAIFTIARGVRVLERIAAVRRAKQRAAFRQDAADGVDGQRYDRLRHQSFEAELDAGDFEVVIANGGANGGADDGVEAGTVAAAGENSDSFGHRAREGAVSTDIPQAYGCV